MNKKDVSNVIGYFGCGLALIGVMYFILHMATHA